MKEKNMPGKNNPYLQWLDAGIEDLIKKSPAEVITSFRMEGIAHWDREGSEWAYSSLASCVCTAAYLFACPQSKWHGAPSLLSFVCAGLSALNDAAVGDRWFHGNHRKGDANIDRFTLLPYLEAYLLVKSSLPEVLVRDSTSVINGVLAFQYKEYKRQTTVLYPNMDIYYCLIMCLGYRITARQEYRDDFEKYLDALQQAQYEDGAWIYYNATNECPEYHDLIVTVMARINEVSGDKRAAEMLTRSVPYYPSIVSPYGVTEYYTDPLWKHTWRKRLPPVGVDIVSSFTGDARNRWIGDQVRRDFLQETVGGSIYVVYAAMYWREVEAVPLEWDTIVYDKNIEGPRGHFRDWSWAATSRVGSDTLVGAMSHTPPTKPVAALLGIAAEIAYVHSPGPETVDSRRFFFGMPPKGTVGKTSINGNHCVYSVAYQPELYQCAWSGETGYPFQWTCAQEWQMDATSLVGQISLISRKKQLSPVLQVRIRFGKNRELEKIADGKYRYGPFLLEILENDFGCISTQPIPACPYMTELDSTEIILAAGGAGGWKYDEGQAFKISLKITHTGG